jgi:Tol biopolymer transport system component
MSDRHGDWALWGVAVKNGKPDGHPFMIRTDMSDSELCNWTLGGLLCKSMYHTRDIFVLPIDPETLEPVGKSRQIPFAPTGGNWCPVWSPDGKYLAFASRTKGAGGDTSIVLLSADGEETRQFKIPENFSTDVISDLRWLPDSSGIGYSGFDENGNPSLFRLTFANEGWKTWPIPIEWWTRIEWNFDGSAFIYAKHGFNSDNPGIIEQNLETGQERYIYQPENGKAGAFRGLKYSLDRKWLTFLMDGAVMVLETETGKAHRASQAGFSFPSWSPDGQQIMVCGSSGKQRRERELFVLPSSGGDGKKIDIGSLPKGSGLRWLDWSPDGRKIAYNVSRGEQATLLMKNIIPKDLP